MPCIRGFREKNAARWIVRQAQLMKLKLTVGHPQKQQLALPQMNQVLPFVVQLT